MEILVSQENIQVPNNLVVGEKSVAMLLTMNENEAVNPQNDSIHDSSQQCSTTINSSDEFVLGSESSPEIGLDDAAKAFASVFHSKLNIRENEEAQLFQAYRRLTSPDKNDAVANEFVIISGSTGVGKTTLAQTLRDRVLFDGGIFCKGKFDSLQSNEPYAAFVAAFTEFTNIVVERGETEVALIRQSILAAVGSEGRVLTDTIPALAKILGNHCERSQTLPPSDALNQFKFLFRMFLRAVCSPERPLVLFLDDIHWADESSLILIQSLAADVTNQGILFVVTIWDDVVPCRKLEEGLEQLRRNNVIVTRVQLQNLQHEAVTQVLSQMLQMEDTQILPLAGIIHRQTEGNLFFILEMMGSLHDDDLLQYDRVKCIWSWNEQDIHLTFQQTSVKELVTDKIFQLPKEAQDMLKVAACLGSKINVEILRHVLSTPVEYHLEMAHKTGLLSANGTPKRYEFAHDGIREATYNLIPADHRPCFHLDIGRALRNLDTQRLDAYIFVVLGQLEKGGHLLLDQSERSVVAALCLRGGAQAARVSSFITASKYFLFGIQLLDDRSWRDEYEVCLELHNCAAEVEYCNGHFASLDSLVENVITKSRSFRDTLRVRACEVYSLGGRNLMPAAIRKGLEVLKTLGVSFPRNPGRFDLASSLRRTRSNIRRFAPEDILTLPHMHDQDKLAAMQMMNLLFLYAFTNQSLLAPLIVCRMVDLTLDHGVCAISSGCMALFAGLLIGCGNRMSEGFQYGELAFDLYNKFNEKAWLGRLSAAYYAFVSGWKHPFGDILVPLKKAHQVALQTGDIEMAMMNANIYCWSALELEELPTLEKEIQIFVDRMEHHGQESTCFMIKPLWQMCQNLLGMATGDPKMLNGNVIDQDDYFAQARVSNPPSVLWSYFYMALLAYIFGDFELAEQRIAMCRDLAVYPFLSFSSVNIVLFDGLAALALVRKERRRRAHRIHLARKAIKLLSRWSDHAPINFLGKLFLLKAELEAAVGTPKAAVSNFTCAIALSSKAGFLMLEALANERTGRYFLETRELKLAARHFQDAHTLYLKWGGFAKAEQLQSEIDRRFKT